MSLNHFISRIAQRVGLICWAVLLSSGLPGCGTLDDHRVPDKSLQETSEFYWTYAALAADVYRTKGVLNNDLSVITLSKWLEKENEVAVRTKDETAIETYGRVKASSAGEIYLNRISERCKGDELVPTLASARGATIFNAGACVSAPPGPSASEYPRPPATAGEARAEAGIDLADAALPKRADDCVFKGADDPPVPLTQAIAKFDWERVPELRRQLHPQGWRMFIPGLAIDVWRRPFRGYAGHRAVEYAIVFRGTSDRGGMVSNIRSVTSITPIVWDQYLQAEAATNDLIEQINKLHIISDAIFHKNDKTEIIVTTVGHSLGGGIATYLYMRIPEVSRVVAFNASPIDGTSLFSSQSSADAHKIRIDDKTLYRDTVVTDRQAAYFANSRFERADILVLYELGDPLTAATGCHTGVMWGSEGGPRKTCASVDFTHKNALYQHNMPQLACNLYLASQGLIQQKKP